MNLVCYFPIRPGVVCGRPASAVSEGGRFCLCAEHKKYEEDELLSSAASAPASPSAPLVSAAAVSVSDCGEVPLFHVICHRCKAAIVGPSQWVTAAQAFEAGWRSSRSGLPVCGSCLPYSFAKVHCA